MAVSKLQMRPLPWRWGVGVLAVCGLDLGRGWRGWRHHGVGFGAYQHDGGGLACGAARGQLVAVDQPVCGDSARAGDVFFSGQAGRFRILG